MQIHEIARCEFYKKTCVLYSKRKNERLGALGIDAYHQLRSSQILVITRTDKTKWVWLPPEDASVTQRAIITTVLTIDCLALGAIFFGPPGLIIGGMLGLRLGLKYGGIGRIVPVLIESKDGKNAYVGFLPLWQTQKLAKILKSGNQIEFSEETAVNTAR